MSPAHMCMAQLSPGIHRHQKHLLPHCTSHILFFDFHTLVPNVASPWQFSPHPLTTSISSSVGLNMGQFCPRGDIWQCLKMFSIVITGSKVLTSMKWTEASDATEHLTVHTPVLQHKVLAQNANGAEISLVPISNLTSPECFSAL